MGILSNRSGHTTISFRLPDWADPSHFLLCLEAIQNTKITTGMMTSQEMLIVIRAKKAMAVNATTPRIKYKQPLPNVSNCWHAPFPVFVGGRHTSIVYEWCVQISRGFTNRHQLRSGPATPLSRYACTSFFGAIRKYASTINVRNSSQFSISALLTDTQPCCPMYGARM